MGLGTGSVPTPPPTPPFHHHPFQQEETSDACSSAGTQALFHGQAAPRSHNTQAQVPLLFHSPLVCDLEQESLSGTPLASTLMFGLH